MLWGAAADPSLIAVTKRYVETSIENWNPNRRGQSFHIKAGGERVLRVQQGLQKFNPVSREPFNEKKYQAAAREFMLGLVSEEDISKMIQAAIKEGRAGNVKALSWLGDYLFGPPSQTLELEAGKNLAELMRRSLEE